MMTEGKMNTIAVKSIACLLVVGASFAAGWRTKTAFVAESELLATKAVSEVHVKVAQQLEDKLSQMRANEKVIERETQTIVQRPIYRSVCLDDDGLRLLESARTGGGAGKPDAALPADPKPSQWGANGR